MNPRMLVLVLLLIVLQCSSAQPGGSGDAPAKKLRVAAVADGYWERNADFFNLLRSALNDVLGDQTEIVFRDSGMIEGDWTLQGVRKIDDRLLAADDVDVILAMGVIASHDLSTRGPLSKPVIAPIVLDPVRQGIPMKGGASGVKNLSYLVFPTTFERDIRLFTEIVPFKKLAYIASRRYAAALPPHQVPLEKLGAGLGVDLTPILIDTSAEEALSAIPSDAQAVYLQPILHLPPREFDKLVRGLIERRLPSFSLLGESEVRQGIMAGANPDFIPRLARRIALHLQRIAAGEDPGTLSVAFPAGKKLFFNFRTGYLVRESPNWDTLLESEIVAFDATSPSAEHYTLASALRRLIDANLDVQAMTREVNATGANVAAARSLLMPSIDLNLSGYQIDKDRAQAGYQPDRAASWEVSATQVVLSEPAISNVSIQASLLDAKERELDLTQLNTIVSGASAYLNLLRARKNFFILLDNLRVTRSNLELAENRRSTGVAGEEEPLRWKAEIAEMKKAVMAVQSQMQQVRYALNQVLNLPLVEELDIADISIDDSSLFVSDRRVQGYFENPIAFDLLTEYMVGRGVERSPELRQIDAVIAANERALSSTRLSYFLPTIGAFARFSNNFYKSGQIAPFSLTSVPAPPAGLDPRVPAYLGQLFSAISPALPDRQDWTVGLQFSLNIFNGFGTHAAEEKTSEQLEAYRIQRNAIVDKVALRIRTDMQNAKSSFFAIQQSRVEQDAARKTLSIVTDGYSRGAIPFLNLLDAQNAALRANQVAVNAQYDFLVTYMQLQRSLGRFDLLMTGDERERFLGEAIDFMESALKK